MVSLRCLMVSSSEIGIDEGVVRTLDDKAGGDRQQGHQQQRIGHIPHQGGKAPPPLGRSAQPGGHRRGEQDSRGQDGQVVRQKEGGISVPPACRRCEHGGEVGHGHAQRFGPEEDPAQIDQEHGIEPLEGFGPAPAQPSVLFQYQEHKIIEPPQHKGPRRPVPDAGEEPDHKEIADVLPAPVHPAAPQREVDIVPKPGGQGDMPPPPELGDAPGDIRDS